MLERQGYWIAFVGVTLLCAVCWLMQPGLILVLGLVQVAFVVLRLQDAGRSSWLILVPAGFTIVAPMAGLLLGAYFPFGVGGDGDALMGGIFGILAGCLAFAGFAIWAGFLPSKRVVVVGEDVDAQAR